MRLMRTHDDYLVEDVLKDPQRAAQFLNAVIEEDDPGLLLHALSLIAKAHGKSKLAEKVSLSRMGMHKALSKRGNPGIRTFLGILGASGLRMSFQPAKPPR